MPDSIQQGRAKTAVAVLAGERPSESRCEGDDVVEKPKNLLAPIRLPHVHERIHVYVSIARVSEDDSAHLSGGERLPHALDVLGQSGQWDCAVLYELHRRRLIKRGQDWAGCVAQLPEVVLSLRRQRDIDVPRSSALESDGEILSARLRRFGALTFDLGEENGRRSFHPLAQRFVRARSARRVSEKGSIEKLTRARSGINGHHGGRGCLFERGERSEHAARCYRQRRERELDSDDDYQRSLAADEHIDQVRSGGVLVDGVPGRFLANARVDDGSTLVQCDDLAVRVAKKSGDGTDPLRRRLPTRDDFAITIAENAVERVHPGTRGSVVKSVSARCVRRNHSAKSAEAPTRRIDRKPESASSCRNIQSRPENARVSPDRSPSLVEFPEVIDAREVDDYPFPDRAARHAAPRAARNESRSGLRRPSHQRDYIVRVDRHRYCCRNHSRYSCRLRIDGAGELIFAERPAKSRRSHEPAAPSSRESITGRGC